MEIEKSVSEVAKRFVYRADEEVSTKLNGDPWMIMPLERGCYVGDCEDFSLTAMYLSCDKSLRKLLWNLLVTKKYKMFSCVVEKTKEKHCVGNIEDAWFDNFTLGVIRDFREFTLVTKHRKFKEHSRTRILLGLYSGALLQMVGCTKPTSYVAATIFNATTFGISYSLFYLLQESAKQFF